MDTDYLTPMAYDCIIIANDASDVLKTDIGAACSRFEDENEYLEGILEFVKEIEKNPEDYLDSWGLLEELDISIFTAEVIILKEHIEKTIETPFKKRGEVPIY